MKHPRSFMLGAPEVLQLNQMLIRAIGAKKVLDVGVFTGSSSLSAALALPDDGIVIGCDICEEYINIGKGAKNSGISKKNW
jgi:predicted O-methyltransferase YrrM